MCNSPDSAEAPGYLMGLTSWPRSLPNALGVELPRPLLFVSFAPRSRADVCSCRDETVLALGALGRTNRCDSLCAGHRLNSAGWLTRRPLPTPLVDASAAICSRAGFLRAVA